MNDVEITNLYAFMDNALTEEEIDFLNTKVYKPEKVISGVVAKNEGPEPNNGYEINEKYRKTDIQWLSVNDLDNIWLVNKLSNIIQTMNQQFYQFNVVGFEDFQYTIYKQGFFYNKHLDMYTYKKLGQKQRKLSFSIQLSDESEYEGCDLILYNNAKGQVMSKNKGRLTLFPSYILHEVTPIIKGERRALVGWVLGDNFC